MTLLTEAGVRKLRVVDLKEELSARSLRTSGKKAVLVERLLAALAEEQQQQQQQQQQDQEPQTQENGGEDEESTESNSLQAEEVKEVNVNEEAEVEGKKNRDEGQAAEGENTIEEPDRGTEDQPKDEADKDNDAESQDDDGGESKPLSTHSERLSSSTAPDNILNFGDAVYEEEGDDADDDEGSAAAGEEDDDEDAAEYAGVSIGDEANNYKILFIEGLKRPYSRRDLTEFLSQHGALVKDSPISTDSLRSMVYAKYISHAHAVRSGKRLQGISWPPIHGQVLTVTLVEKDGFREGDGEDNQVPAHGSRRTSARHSASSPAKPSAPPVSLDELFHKTKALPQIYWLPAKHADEIKALIKAAADKDAELAAERAKLRKEHDRRDLGRRERSRHVQHDRDDSPNPRKREKREREAPRRRSRSRSRSRSWSRR